MNIYMDNVDVGSRSGPNHFAKKLKKYMNLQGDTFTFSDKFDVQISFIQKIRELAPIYQRLDGIYFNKAFDYNLQNKNILETYKIAKGVIFQSEFNRDLTFKYFGEHSNYRIIHNGADLDYINRVETLNHVGLDKYENVWSCASSWRPHKRLGENIKYFLQHGGEKDCLIVAGEVANHDMVINDRIHYVGDLNIETLTSLYKRSKYFIHLAYLDHCPNVVVDAAACGCQIVCSSSGGTKEVAPGAIIIEEDPWSFEPTLLYEPPRLDFTRKKENQSAANLDMVYVAAQYNKFLGDNNENN